jgi:deoxyribose-phosphate aldolase
MAWRYRDAKTKQFVSVSTWTRSKAHGGHRFIRESNKTDRKATRKAVARPEKAKPVPMPIAPTGAIKTVEDWNAMIAAYDGEFDEGEAGTGVDYGEEE